MIKYKQLIIGFILGVLVFYVVPVGAAIEEFICYRADYKVMINGVEYSNPDLPILNYKGNTYAPFRSILEKAGLNVDWNTELSQAEVTSNITSAQKTISKEINTMTTSISTKPDSTPDGITMIDEWQGKYYIDVAYIDKKVKEKGYQFKFDIGVNGYQLIKGEQVILDKIPTTYAYGGDCVEYSFYVNNIMPLVK